MFWQIPPSCFPQSYIFDMTLNSTRAPCFPVSHQHSYHLKWLIIFNQPEGHLEIWLYTTSWPVQPSPICDDSHFWFCINEIKNTHKQTSYLHLPMTSRRKATWLSIQLPELCPQNSGHPPVWVGMETYHWPSKSILQMHLVFREIKRFQTLDKNQYL